MTSPAVRLSYAIVVAFVACVVVAFASLAYASHVNGQSQKRAEQARVESDRRWCALLGDLDSAYSSTPLPSTPTGKKVAEEIHRLRLNFGCPAK